MKIVSDATLVFATGTHHHPLPKDDASVLARMLDGKPAQGDVYILMSAIRWRGLQLTLAHKHKLGPLVVREGEAAFAHGSLDCEATRIEIHNVGGET